MFTQPQQANELFFGGGHSQKAEQESNTVAKSVDGGIFDLQSGSSTPKQNM